VVINIKYCHTSVNRQKTVCVCVCVCVCEKGLMVIGSYLFVEQNFFMHACDFANVKFMEKIYNFTEKTSINIVIDSACPGLAQKYIPIMNYNIIRFQFILFSKCVHV